MSGVSIPIKDITLSKNLSRILRHQAKKENLPIDDEGYIPTKSILTNPSFKEKYTVEDIQRVVANDDKQRFTIRVNRGVLEICANQRHSIKISNDTTLIKSLSRILRHRANQENLPVDEEGYVPIDSILTHPSFKGKYTVQDIQRVVANDDKQRFTIRVNRVVLEICANQRHSVKTSNNTALSKSLCRILSHQAKKENLPIDDEGYIPINSILTHHSFKEKYTLEDIQRVVANDDKQKFTIRVNKGVLEICANQGHSVKISKDKTLSKSLCRILRHQPKQENLPIDGEGYIPIDSILTHPSFKGKYTVEEIQRVVANDDKQRFTIRVNQDVLEICATQGHSVKASKDITLSKSICRILRHRAKQENLPIDEEGYVPIDSILTHPSFKGKYTVEDIQRVVAKDDKQKLTIRVNQGVLEIRANQEHSVKARKDITLSKSLCRILRYQAKKENLPIDKQGYVPINSILSHHSFTGKYTLEDIQRVVDTNDRQRFTIRVNKGVLEICANRRYSIKTTKDITLSKNLTRILRHQAKKENLPIDEEGYIPINSILTHRSFRGKYTLEDIQRVVATNNKQRFTIRVNQGVLEICANQGHSIKTVIKLHLLPILEPQQYNIIHGTFFNNWTKIKIEGLSRMNRNHIHFAKGLPSDSSVISGMRKSCQIYIYLNLQLALNEGLKFFESSNGVILSEGDESGFIKPKYFLKVTDFSGQPV